MPSGSGISSAAISSAVLTAARVRMDWMPPPTSPRPPEASCWTCDNWRETSLLVTPKPLINTGSRLTCTSRLTPPSRDDLPDAFGGQQFLGDFIIHKPRQALLIKLVGGDGHGEDRAASGAEFGNDRVESWQRAGWRGCCPPHCALRFARLRYPCRW